MRRATSQKDIHMVCVDSPQPPQLTTDEHKDRGASIFRRIKQYGIASD